MNDLDQLKELLFGAEKRTLDSITERVGRREVRTADVAEVLPGAIEHSHRSDSALVESLTEPVGQCMQRALHDDPETFGDALYPVMGPAIRKSIMHALHNFAQQINEAVEHSVSPRGLKWRWQASRAGVPFGEYVLQKTMLYRVEQAYLISRENGLLVGHVHHEASKIKDSDAVSAMFTAIQDFVKESFSPARSGRLESADMGEFTLWAVHGPHALLVCVIRGVPPKGLRADLSAILERIHFRYGDAIRDYRGDTSSVPDVESELERCLRFEAHQAPDEKRDGLPRWMAVFLLLLFAAGVYFAFRSYVFSQELDRLNAALAATPGIHVTSAERDGGDFTIRGLRDPLAASIADIADGVGVPAERLSADFKPFQSLQPEIVLARARQKLAPPASVSLELSGTTLNAGGEASPAWRDRLHAASAGLAGIDAIDDSGLTVVESTTLAERVAALDGRRFHFASGSNFVAGAEDALRAHAAALLELRREAAEAGQRLSITLVGSTDSLGAAAANVALARNRAAAGAAVLAQAGLESQIARLSVIPDSITEAAEDAGKRHVQVNLALQPLSR